jgi:hypothetical protein
MHELCSGYMEQCFVKGLDRDLGSRQEVFSKYLDFCYISKIMLRMFSNCMPDHWIELMSKQQ